MIAAAMDDDNESGMAVCDCLSEYQDDAGEWRHREQRSQRYRVTLLNIPRKVVSGPGPLGILCSQSRRIWLECRVPGQVGGAGCLKYPNLYVFDEAGPSQVPSINCYLDKY